MPHRLSALLATTALLTAGGLAAARAEGGAGGAGFGGAGGADSPFYSGDAGSLGTSSGGGGGAGETGGSGAFGGGLGGGSPSGRGQDGSAPGSGGGGGAHGTVQSTLPQTAVIGGNGGFGAGNTQANGDGGGGGAGGWGAVIIGSGPLGTLGASIIGGAGGGGGNSADGNGGNGGSGGTGLSLSGGPVTLDIAANILGGAGGSGGTAGPGGIAGNPGAGGAGLAGSDVTITLGAVIAGGAGGDGGGLAPALNFTGGTNVLTLAAGANLLGGIAVEGTLEFAQTTAAELSNPISGFGAISKTGAGVLTLNGAGSFSGGTSILGGTLMLGALDALGTGLVSIGGGTLAARVGGTLSNDLRAEFGATATIAAAAGTTLTLTGAVALNPSSTLVFAGPGIIAANFAAADLFDPASVALRVAGGTLRAESAVLGSMTAGAAATVIDAGATLDFNGQSGPNAAIAHLRGGGTLTNSALTWVSAGDFSGVIAGAGSLEKTGLGTLILSGGNSYAGGTEISAGTLQIGAGGTSGRLGGGAVINDGLLVFNRSDNIAVSNAISGGGTVQQAGTGVLTLSAANSYSGGTSITAGTLALDHMAALGSGAVTIGDAALRSNLTGLLANAIELGAGATGRIAAATGETLTLTGALAMRPGATLVIGSTTEAGRVVASFASADLFNPASLGLRIAGGTLQAGNAGFSLITQLAASTTIQAGATLDLNGHTGVIGNLQGAGRLTNDASTQIGAGSFSGVIGGAGGIDKTGAGTLTLTGANTYAGTTTISEGRLVVGQGGNLGGGAVTNNAALAFQRGDALTVANAISGSGSLTQAGTGTLTLTGANTYAGTTTIQAGGTLQLGNGGTSGSIGAAGVVNNGMLAVNRLDAVTLGNAISGSGGLNQMGPGRLTLTGANSYSGLTSIAPGSTIEVGNGGSLGTGGVSGGALVFSRTGSVVLAGPLSGVSLTLAGAGTVILTGNSDGQATINPGATLQLGNGGTQGALTGGGLQLDIHGGIVQTGAPVLNNGRLVFQRSDSVTLSRLITGTGSVAVQSGTVSLTQDNAYSGGTSIAPGATLRVVGGVLLPYNITFGSLPGNVVNEGTLVFQSGYRMGFSGVISGGGTVILSGGDGVTLTGANTYSGNTILQAGFHRLEGAGTFGSGNVTFQPGAYLDVSATTGGTGPSFNALNGQGTLRLGSRSLTLGANGGTSLFAGVITDVPEGFPMPGMPAPHGGGGLIVAGGVATLTGANDYAGTTRIETGATLQIGDGGASGALGTGRAMIGLGGMLAFNRSDTGFIHAGAIDNNGLLVQRGTGRTTLNGVIGGTGGVLVEAGTLVLGAANTYTGTTRVNAGMLVVNGSIASSSGVITGEGGVLGGNGLFPGITVGAGASISPGNSIGTMQVSSLTLSSGATTVIEVQGATADRINVAGTARIAGTLRLVPLGGPYQFNAPYTLIQAGAVTGGFASVTTQGSFGAGITPSVTSTAQAVQLTLAPAPLAEIITPPAAATPSGASGPAAPSAFVLAGTRNQIAVASGLDRAATAGADVSAFFPLYNLPAAALPRALDLLSGQVHVAGMRAQVETSTQFLTTLLDPRRLAEGDGDDAAPARYRVWASGFGGAGRRGGDGNQGSYAVTGNAGGMAVGADIRLAAGIVAGVALAGAGTQASLGSGMGRAESSQVMGAAYAVAALGALRLAGAVSYGGADVTTRRQAGFLGLGNLQGRGTPHGAALRLEAGWRFEAMGLALTPGLAFQGGWFDTPGFTERATGAMGPAALRVARGNQGTARIEIGLRADAALGASITGFARAGWAIYLQRDAGMSASFASLPEAGFALRGARPDPQAALLSAGLDWRLSRAVTLTARLDTELSANGAMASGTARLSYSF